MLEATELQSLWPGWETRRVIGRGSFGTVYEIYREVLGHEEVSALKVVSIPDSKEDIVELQSEGYDNHSISQHYKKCLEEIVKEYSMMLDLRGSSNVVHCDDLRYVPHADGFGWTLYIKMELLTPMRKTMPLAYDENSVVQLGMDISRALKLCQAKQIIHRDIKPENIFVSADGNYKLGDFGVAKVSSKTASGTKIGTYDYMSPEVYLNLPYSFASDIYSLGLVMYWMMNSKRTPFLDAGSSIPTANEKELARAKRMAAEPLPRPVNGTDDLWEIVKKACAFQVAERYRNADELYQALAALAAQRFTVTDNPVTTAPIPVEEPAPFIAPEEEEPEAVAEAEDYAPTVKTEDAPVIPSLVTEDPVPSPAPQAEALETEAPTQQPILQEPEIPAYQPPQETPVAEPVQDIPAFEPAAPAAPTPVEPAPQVRKEVTRVGVFEEKPPAPKKKKKRWIALLLAIFPATGIFAIHDFYLGRWRVGLFKMCTINRFYVGWILDIIFLAIGRYKGKDGEYL